MVFLVNDNTDNVATKSTSLVAQGEYSKPRAVLLRAECCWIMLFMLLILIIPAARGC